MSVGNTCHLIFFSIFTFSNQFLSIYHIHFIGHIFIYTSLIINKFLAPLSGTNKSLVAVLENWQQVLALLSGIIAVHFLSLEVDIVKNG